MATETQPPFDVKAIAPYTARNNTEVSLEVGKIYRVTQTDGRGLWWQTKSDTGSVGWFPASYTQVIPNAAPTVPVHAAVPPPQPSVAATPVYTQPTTQTQPSHQQPTTVTTPAVSNASSADKPPAPSRDQKEQKQGACFVNLQIVEARGLQGVSNKSTPMAFVYRREVLQDSKTCKPIFFTNSEKKTDNPRWNEFFQITINDAELEVLCIRFVCGKGKTGWKAKSKDYIGEIDFPLRGAVRKFDKPNGLYQWFPIKGGKEKTGEALIFIEFVDTRESEGPKNVKHEGHVGISAEGGFEIRDIPSEWKQLFRVLNIKKKDLESNPEYAKEVMSIMHNAVNQGDIPNPNPEPVQEIPPAGHTQATPPPPPIPSTSATTVPAPPPVPSPHVSSGPAPPPPPAVKGPAPPPPPPVNAGPPAPKPPPAPVNAGPAPPPPPSGGGGGGSGGGGVSVLDQIKAGGFKLKKAEVTEGGPSGPQTTGNALADTLLNAMNKYRGDIVGNDDGNDADDWSE